ncbi:nitrogenase component 1 [Sporomusa termitida]|uniref:Light-independent protochlorophyllide reductase subunit B n=1 Tax=Sporomusa termitida TaxID=2377 RepID=A0A517DP11_9FIRM|nr:nitrogenase component 1 [Sporomusa termitida]QDR79099.1 Light-independent protochlorophyllide reductase subunit B [Sporomusa termitida]
MVKSKRPVVSLKSGCSCSMPGVWRAVAHSDGAVVIFHSPKACAHITQEMGLGIHYRLVARQEFVPGRYRAPLISSELNDEHSIFGGAEQLRACIRSVAGRYRPSYIVIASSCVAGIIGDDIAEVAALAEQEFTIPVIASPCSGYLDGEYHAGYYHTAMAVAERFITTQPTLPDTVTLLGDRGGPDSEDCQEMERLLHYFGLEVHAHFPGYASLNDMRRVAASSLNILIGGRAQSYAWIRRLAVGLEARSGTPFFDRDHPVGWLGTTAWLAELGALLARPQAARQAIAAEQQRLQAAVFESRRTLRLARVALVIGRPLQYFEPGWVLELLAQAEIELVAVVLLQGLTGQQQEVLRQALPAYTQIPVLLQSQADATLRTAELVMTTHELDDENLRQFFIPVLPPIGVSGFLRQLQKLERLAQRPALRGGILYG